MIFGGIQNKEVHCTIKGQTRAKRALANLRVNFFYQKVLYKEIEAILAAWKWVRNADTQKSIMKMYENLWKSWKVSLKSQSQEIFPLDDTFL